VEPYKDIELIGSTIRNGRIYFSSHDIKFFPSDSFGDRERGKHKGKPVLFDFGDNNIETDIRISSSTRISPRSSFASFLKSVGAKEGEFLRVTRTSEREYSVEYLGA